MTFVVYVIFGVGVLLIASALDGSSIVQTLQAIIAGKPINWTAALPPSPANQQPTQNSNAHTQQQSTIIPPTTTPPSNPGGIMPL